MNVFINPGHGGNDSGATGFDLNERDVALQIGKGVAHYLNFIGYQTRLFQFNGLQTICDEANNSNADLFISIHCNAFDSNAHGAECFYAPRSIDGYKAARAIQSQLTGSLPLRDRQIASAYFFVLMNTVMPAVLVETAFIDNYHDNYLLKHSQDAFARAIARGITDWEVSSHV